jgi:hypothetical protein
MVLVAIRDQMRTGTIPTNRPILLLSLSPFGTCIPVDRAAGRQYRVRLRHRESALPDCDVIITTEEFHG